MAQQAYNLLMEFDDHVYRLRFLVRNLDTKFTSAFDAGRDRLVKIPLRAPKADAYAERWVRTARSECLDWTLIWNQWQLRRVLIEYLSHYNTAGPRRSSICSRPPLPVR